MAQSNAVNDVKPTLVIEPPRGLASLNLADVWQYREIVSTFVGREIKLRYRQTAFGVLWVVLQPLLTAGIGTFVFGQIAGMGQGDPAFFLRAFAGQLGWIVFGLSVFKISTSLVGNSAMLSKVFFPRLTLPLASVIAAQLDFFISLAALLLLTPLFGIWPGLPLLTLPLWFGLLAIFALGIGMMVAALMVSYRDVGFILPFALNAVQLLSPVAWPLSKMPASLAHRQGLYFLLNPLAPLIEGMRWSLLGGTYPVAWGWAVYAAAVSVLACLAGMLIFRHEERRFADVL